MAQGQGIADILPLLPPILLAHWSVSAPTPQVLGDARIAGSTDPQYGTVGWGPRLDGMPWACLSVEGAADKPMQPNRYWAHHDLRIFLALIQATVPGVDEDYNLQLNAWMDRIWYLVAANRRINNIGGTISTFAFDVRWTMLRWKKQTRRTLLGVDWYGAEVETDVLIVLNAPFPA